MGKHDADINDYPFIRAWCAELGSLSYYVREQVSRARQDRAPHNAIYKNNEGVWVTYDQVTSMGTRFNMDARLTKLGVDPGLPDPKSMLKMWERTVEGLERDLAHAREQLNEWKDKLDDD